VSSTGHPRGLLIVGHGTRDEQGNHQFFALIDQLRESLLGTFGRSEEPFSQQPQPLLPLVQPALLEFQQPDIPAAWRLLVDRGVERIDVVPLLLFAAGHAKSDIPEQIAAVAGQGRRVDWRITRPLSRHRLIVDLVCQRIAEVLPVAERGLGQPPHPQQEVSLLMVGRGSHDPCARSDMLVLSEIVRHRFCLKAIETAFYAMADPRLEDTLESIAARGIPRVLVVYPHILFAGRLYDSIVQKVLHWGSRFPECSVRICRYLGPVEEVAGAIIDRVQNPSLGLNSAKTGR